jgi:hypothetical protein
MSESPGEIAHQGLAVSWGPNVPSLRKVDTFISEDGLSAAETYGSLPQAELPFLRDAKIVTNFWVGFIPGEPPQILQQSGLFDSPFNNVVLQLDFDPSFDRVIFLRLGPAFESYRSRLKFPPDQEYPHFLDFLTALDSESFEPEGIAMDLKMGTLGIPRGLYYSRVTRALIRNPQPKGREAAQIYNTVHRDYDTKGYLTKMSLSVESLSYPGNASDFENSLYSTDFQRKLRADEVFPLASGARPCHRILSEMARLEAGLKSHAD